MQATPTIATRSQAAPRRRRSRRYSGWLGATCPDCCAKIGDRHRKACTLADIEPKIAARYRVRSA